MQQKQFSENKNGTFSVQGIGNIRTEQGRIGRQHRVIGRPLEPTSRCLPPVELKK